MSTEQAYLQYRAELLRYIAKRIGSHQSAEDIAQDMFLRFMRSSQGADIREPAAYLRTIASHLIHGSHTRKKRDPVIFDSDLADSVASQSDRPSMEDVSNRCGTEREIALLLSQLPPLYAAILVLKKRDGMSHVEIADALEISVHTVKKYLFLAVTQCRASAQVQP